MCQEAEATAHHIFGPLASSQFHESIRHHRGRCDSGVRISFSLWQATVWSAMLLYIANSSTKDMRIVMKKLRREGKHVSGVIGPHQRVAVHDTIAPAAV